jgi:type III secretory pathway component EscS
MAIDRHDVVFQSIGGLLALAFVFTGVAYAVHAFGRLGVLSLFVIVPIGVAAGWLTAKLLHFARRILTE